MKKIACLVLLMMCSSFTFGQSDQYLSTSYGFAFFGSGDLGGTSLGVNYARILYKRLGVHGGLLKSTGSGNFLPEGTVINVSRVGSNTSSNIATYNTVNLGVVYRATDGTKQSLFLKGGVSYNSIRNNRVDSFGTPRDIDIPDGSIEVFSYSLVRATNIALHIMIDYQQYIDDNFFLGLHLASYPGEDIHSHAGVSLGLRF